MTAGEKRRGNGNRRGGDGRQQRPVFNESLVRERIGAERYAASPNVSMGGRDYRRGAAVARNVKRWTRLENPPGDCSSLSYKIMVRETAHEG